MRRISGLRNGVRQVAVEAEAYSHAPGLLRRVLAELLQHALATFSTVLANELPGEPSLCWPSGT